VAVALLDRHPLLASETLYLRQGDQVGVIVQAEAGRVASLIHVSLVDALVEA
jgi:hypothetical protein